MEITTQAAHTRPMNHEQLFDQAVDLAYRTFEDPTDAHITAVYAVLVDAAKRGEVVDVLVLH